jgi:polyisoprenoid-binding protein YceI
METNTLTADLVDSVPVTGQWSLDKAHSRLGFTITHLSITKIRGSFKQFESTITAPTTDWSGASVELTADINSVNTENEQRDEHLKKDDFLDTATYPGLAFKSTAFIPIKDDQYKVTGNLTLHGETKPVELEAIYNGIMVHPMTKKEMAGFTVTGTIRRADFGIATAVPDMMLGNKVVLSGDLQFAKEA